MKKINKALSAFTALTLGSTAAISVVGCSSCSRTIAVPTIVMDEQLLVPLELKEANGSWRTRIRLILSLDSTRMYWEAEHNETALHLLNQKNKAINDKAGEFLTQYLGLIPDKNGVYDRLEASKYKLKLYNPKPNFIPTENNDNYFLTGGTVEGYWHKDNKVLVNVKGIQLKTEDDPNLPPPDNEKDKLLVYKNILKANPIWEEESINIDDTNDFKKEGILEEFQAGKPVKTKDHWKGQDITKLLNLQNPPKDSGAEWMKHFIPFFAEKFGEVKIATTSLELKDKNAKNLASGDKLNFKVSLGEVEFATEFSFVIPEEPTF